MYSDSRGKSSTKHQKSTDTAFLDVNSNSRGKSTRSSKQQGTAVQGQPAVPRSKTAALDRKPNEHEARGS